MSFSNGGSIAIALTNLSILLIDSFGWRSVYGIMASMGIAAGMALLLLMKNPKKATKRLDQKQLSHIVENECRNVAQNMKEMNRNKVIKNVLWGGIFKTFGTSILSYFLPVFFQNVYP